MHSIELCILNDFVFANNVVKSALISKGNVIISYVQN